jgi:hypothetical protein
MKAFCYAIGLGSTLYSQPSLTSVALLRTFSHLKKVFLLSESPLIEKYAPECGAVFIEGIALRIASVQSFAKALFELFGIEVLVVLGFYANLKENEMMCICNTNQHIIRFRYVSTIRT